MPVDGRTAVWVATHRIAGLDGIFVWLGNIDRIGAIWVALAAILCAVTRRGWRESVGLVIVTALTTFAADSLAFGVKDLTSRTRPFVAHPEIHPLYVVHSSSLPAGHAATAFAGATFLTYVWRRGWPGFFALAIAICYSRVYVGVHYPTDVLAGAVLGLAVGAAAVLVWVWALASRPWTRSLASSPSSTTS